VQQDRAWQVETDRPQRGDSLQYLSPPSSPSLSLSLSSPHPLFYSIQFHSVQSISPEECASLKALSMPCAMTLSPSLLAVWRNSALADRIEMDADTVCSNPGSTPPAVITERVRTDVHENTVRFSSTGFTDPDPDPAAGHSCGIRCSCVALSTQHSAALHGTALHGTAQHSTARHSTARHNTKQDHTAQPTDSPEDVGRPLRSDCRAPPALCP
jgi:hypothetical protein